MMTAAAARGHMKLLTHLAAASLGLSCAQGAPHAEQVPLTMCAHGACAEWTAACVECQTAIANCFERSSEPVFDGSAECTACHAELQACMASIDKQYWPNR